MKIHFDKYYQPNQPKIYLGTPNNKIICALSGIEENTFTIVQSLNNVWELSFDVNRYVEISSFDDITKEVESNSYKLLDLLMRIYVEDIGWFIMKPPTISNDGTKEIKSIKAESAEIEMLQHDIKSLKINKGTTDSYEMLVNGNVQMIGEVEFAKEQIKFYNSSNPELSFLNILMKVSGLYGWSIGYIDTTPKEYKYFGDVSSISETLANLTPGSYVYIDLIDGRTIEVYRTSNGKVIYTDIETKVELSEVEILELTTLKNQQLRKQIMLEDEVGSFDIEIQDLYSFLTQDTSKYFSCVFVFDFLNFKINAYRPENLGKDTNINIGFRNLQQSNEISVEENNLFTRYNVQGSDDLGITYVNFGSNVIENIDHFLNQKYLSEKLIQKYKLWQNDVESSRLDYIKNTRIYNEQQAIIGELKNRVPLDGCSTDWSTFKDDELLEAQENYRAQLKGYEEFYVDEDDNFDQSALDASSDANDYYQIKDVILPSIQIEIDNRNLTSEDDELDYIDSYKTDWKLYGLDELDVNLKIYKNNKKLAEDEKCDTPYDETSGHTQDYHEALYEKYVEAVNQLNPDFLNSCMAMYNERESEIDSAKSIQEQCDDTRKAIVKLVEKETWSKEISKNSDEYYTFTARDLSELSSIYVDGSYTNDNMFLTGSDDSVSTIDEQLKLLSIAQEDLDIASQKQYTYTTNLDNFLAKYEYKNYTDNLDVGDFIYLGVRDDYVVKLRVMSIQYNPLVMDNNLEITFSNMLKTASGRLDYSYLLDSSNGGSKQTSSGNSSNDYLSNEGITLTASLLQKLLSSGAFSNKVTQIINNEFAGYVGKTITVNELNAKIIKVADIEGKNGFFQYLQSKLISADKIVSESGEFKKLLVQVAEIDKIVAGEINVDKITGTIGEFEQFFIKYLNVSNVFGENAAFKSLVSDIAKITTLNVDNITGTTGSFDEFFVNNFRVNTVFGDNADFNTLVSKLFTTDKIVANLADIDKANIDKLFAKNAFTESLAALSASISTATIDKAYITRIVSANMTVGDLQAGDITLSNSMRIISQNGKMMMNGNVLQIMGRTSTGTEYVGIQLGYDTSNNPSLILRDESGVLLLTSRGITENAIADGLIVNDMLHTGTISKDKLGFSFVEPNEYGGIDITHVYDGKGNLWGVEYDSFKDSVTTGFSSLDKKIDNANQTIENLQTHIGSVIDKDNATIKDSVWEKTYLYKPKLDVDGNVQYDDDGKIIKEKDAYNIIDRTVEQIISLDGIISTVGTTDAEGLRKKITTAQQTADKFYWLVEGNSTSSSLTLTDNALTAIAEEVKFMSPDGKSVVIRNGKILAEAITTDMIATDIIKSKNYRKDIGSSPFSVLGTFLDLSNGAIYTPAFGTDGLNKAYINGEIIATSGRIGETESNSWQIGTVYNTNLEPSAAIIANGDAYVWAGNWTLGIDKINTYNNGDYLFHNNIYYDLGMMSPVMDTASTDYVNSKVSNNFLYIRKHTNSIPTLEDDWEYVFRVDGDGTVYENGVALSKKYASIDGVSGTYLPLTGGEIQNNLTVLGNLTVNGTITGIVNKANQLTHTLSVNGKGWNGSADINIGTIGVGYGGTGRTSWTANAIVYAISSSSLGQLSVGTSGQILQSKGNSTPVWVNQNTLSVASAVKATKDASGNIIIDTYLRKDFNTINQNVSFGGSINIDNLTAKSLLINGVARFVNGIEGDLTGNVSGIASETVKFHTSRKIGNAPFDGTADITLAQIGAATSSHTHSNYATKITLDGVSYNASSNNIAVTRVNLITALGAASGTSDGYMARGDKEKLDAITVSDIGTVGANSIKGAGAISVLITDGVATISHGNSGVSAGIYGADSTNYFRIPKITINNLGHITAAGYYDITGANLVSRIGNASVVNAINATKSSLLSNLFSARPVSADIIPTGSGGIASFKATSSMTDNKPNNDAHILHMYWDNTGGYDAQLSVPASSGSIGSIQYRGQSSGTWSNWLTLLDSKNYTNFVPSKTGSGASGIWTISITGNADAATKAVQDGSGNIITEKYVTVDTAQNISGIKTITNTTASTSKITGALKVSGGVGINGQMSANKVMVDNGTEKCTLEMDEYGALNFVFL